MQIHIRVDRALVESDLGTEQSDCDRGIPVTEVQQPAEVKQLMRKMLQMSVDSLLCDTI
jgi:hypothetical protein